jgi:GT2 family glycosyltransferase
MDLSVLIVNWNTREFTRNCLRSLAATSDRVEADRLACGPYQVEVIVVDNGSQDQSVEMIRAEFPWVRLIENARNRGFAPANNQAYQISSGRYVLLLNSDTAVLPGAVRTLLEFMESHPDCGGGGALLRNADGSLQPSCHPMLTPWREFWRLTFLDRAWRRATYAMTRWDTAQPRTVEAIKGACLIVRRAALEPAAPLLDEQYFMYTEEVDLCYRLAQRGWRLYWIPQAQVTHFGEVSSRQAYTTMYVQLYRSKVQFYRKFGGEPRARRFKQLVAWAYWPRFLVAQAAMPLRPSLAARVNTFSPLMADLPKM